jgi:hypothetical protein
MRPGTVAACPRGIRWVNRRRGPSPLLGDRGTYVGIRTSYVVVTKECETLSRSTEEKLGDNSQPVRVLHAAQFAGGVHGEQGHADVDCPDP